MATEVKVPALGESITEAVVMEWLVAPGDAVEVDQDIVVLETDKITVNVPSPVGGVLTEQKVGVDDEVEIGAIIALIDESAEVSASADGDRADDGAAAPSDDGSEADSSGGAEADADAGADAGSSGAPVMPAARRLAAENDLDTASISGSGRGGRVLKEDVQRRLDSRKAKASAEATAKESARPQPGPGPKAPAAPSLPAGDEQEDVVRMSKLRRTIAERLVKAQQDAAILTTFNEVDMTAVKALRARYRDAFEKKHGVRLGYTSFFAKAAIEALKAFPAVNAEIRGDDTVYKNYFHIGVAVGGGRGLVVPVIRHADRISFAEFELKLNELAAKARDNKLSLDDLTGGTFTISNGGVYGSLLSTPILNPPQVGILGLHKIEDRAVVVDGQVVVRPMMYLALSYDHRIIDGREAVSFLVRLKECIEDPSRILLEV